MSTFFGEQVGVVPFVGGFLGGLWLLIVQLIGLKEIHETTYPRVIIAFLLPIVLVFILIIAIVVPIVIFG